jgi:voltage-gated potassium channel Kch
MTSSQGSQQAFKPVNPRAANLLTRRPLSARRAARIIASFTVSVTVIAGVLMHFTDKQNFPTVGDGLWWAVQTVTTVGYGDVVPTSTTGRLIAALVMIGGIGFLTVITAAITSTFIENARRQLDGHSNELLSAKLDELSGRLDAIDAKLSDLARRDHDAQP